jgi:hypothetical protein
MHCPFIEIGLSGGGQLWGALAVIANKKRVKRHGYTARKNINFV